MMSYDVLGFCLVSFRLQALSQKLDSTLKVCCSATGDTPKHGGKHGGNMLECRDQHPPSSPGTACAARGEKGPETAFLTWVRGLSEMKS